MPHRVAIVMVLVVLAVAACRDHEASVAADTGQEAAPPSLAGSAQDFGIRVKCVHLERTRTGIDARFEVENQGRAIVNVQAAQGDTASEVALSADVFRRGKWEPETPAVSNSLPFDDLWPGATQYARTMLPLDARWARVR